MSLTPKIKEVPKPTEARADPVQVQVLGVLREQVIVKEPVSPHGWRFVPVRDENNLIIEIIATPI